MEAVTTQSFDIGSLDTHSVTIFPQNAQIVRVLKNIALKSGSNCVEIVGLSPTIDEGSIKVDGHGKASISSVIVESIRNPKNFRDVYDSDSEGDLDRPDPQRLPEKPERLRELETAVTKLKAEINRLDEAVARNKHGIRLLAELVPSGESQGVSAEEMTKRLDIFDERSHRYTGRIQEASDAKRPLVEELPKLTAERDAANRDYLRQTKEMRKEVMRAEAKWKRTRKARQRARREQFAERRSLWPQRIYKITIIIEGHSSDAVALKDRPEQPPPSELDQENSESDARTRETVALSLSYVTSDASWVPAYDISIDSITRTGTLVYRAEVSNQTSETWRNAQVTISTSQTSFKGVQDPIPKLQAWNMMLLKRNFPRDDALTSPQERQARALRIGQSAPPPSKRGEQFGLGWSDLELEEVDEDEEGAEEDEKGPSSDLMYLEFGDRNSGRKSSTKKGAKREVERVGRNFRSLIDLSRDSAASRKHSLQPVPEFPRSASCGNSPGHQGAPWDAMQISDAAWEETGLTATWDLSGCRTIKPSSKKHRHRIATIDLTGLELKHVCVPKLRSDAFLTMDFRNPSDQTVLPGQAGLTLDGAFLGTTSLKRVAPGEMVTISLGVDEGIVVEYAKPIEKKNLTSGIINKDSSAAFRRCIILRHAKSSSKGTQPVEISIRDQIPVCQDERIRLDLLQPVGLRPSADPIRAGEAVRDENAPFDRRASVRKGGSESARGEARDEAWGRATVTLDKEGTVEWKVRLLSGKKAAFPLEYELRYPASETLSSA